MQYNELKQIIARNGELRGWDFSHMKTMRDPVLWDYVEVVRQYLKPTDRVLDVGTGGCEIFSSLSPYFAEGIGVDQQAVMIETARENLAAQSIDNISLMQMEAADLQFKPNSFDVVLVKHLRVYVDEVLRVLRPGGIFITQLVGQRTGLNILEAFGWTPASFGDDWWQTAAELAHQFRQHNCHILAEAEYDVPYWFLDVESLLFYVMSIPLPEKIELEKHWQMIANFLKRWHGDSGIESNEHCGLLIVQKL